MADEGIEEAWEPFEIVQLLASKAVKDPKRKEAIEQNFLADMLGEVRIPPPPSDEPEYITSFIYSYMHLYASYNRFDLYKVMIAHYPWRGRISQRDHLFTSVHMLLHEAYIFEERLKRYFAAVEAVAANLGVAAFDRTTHSRTIRSYHRAFENLLRARGVHVHRNEFEPEELGWLGTLELLAMVPGAAPWRALLPTAKKRARQRWLTIQADVKAAAGEFLTLAVRQTKPVWSELKKHLSQAS